MNETQPDNAAGNETRKRQSVERQAVVLIHGIGEQRPMATLRSFVAAFFPDAASYHSKPDTISNSYELRRIKIRRVEKPERVPGKQTEKLPEGVNADWPETDFYEYYWAHQMHGTRVSHVTSWLVRTMRSGFRAARKGDWNKLEFHPRLRTMLPLVWIGGGVLVAGVVSAAALAPGATAITSGAALALAAIWNTFIGPVVQRTLTDVVGDAARYLDVAPQNVARRYDIIRGGIDMLHKLHDEHAESEEKENEDKKVLYRYSRVVLVGHSLGSLIAYDLLRHYWMEVNGKLCVDPAKLAAVESFDGGECKELQHGVATHADRTQFRHDQRQCWRAVNDWWWLEPRPLLTESKVPGRARWLISDLVTLGCPLTYAPLLMADNLDDFHLKIRLRELLTCPPNRSQHVTPGRFGVSLSYEAEVFTSYPILNHGAPFALTRWTNLYFKNDPVGGRLVNVLRDGIEDVPLDPDGLRMRPMTAHVSYWNRDCEAAKPSIQKLAAILKDHPLGLRRPPQIGR